MTRGEEEEKVKDIIVVAVQRKGKAKRARLDAFDADQRIIWQRSARSTKRDPRRNVEIASLSIPLKNVETGANRITRKSRRRQPKSSKE